MIKNKFLKALLIKERVSHFVIPTLLFSIVFILYFLTMPNVNVGYADSDEFTTAAKVLGVAHSPGYPLYIMMISIFARLPLPLSFAGRINLLSVLLDTFTVVLVYLSGLLFLRRLILDSFTRSVISFIGSMSLALMFSFWFYSVFAEVFPLNNFLAALTLFIILIWEAKYTSVKVSPKSKKLRNSNKKLLIAAAFIFGLGLSNQQVIILILPMVVFWVFFTRRKTLSDWRLLINAFTACVVGLLLPYIYVLIASRHLPIINWENAQNLNGVYRLITRRIYAESAPNGMAYTTYKFSIAQVIEGSQRYIGYLVSNYNWAWVSTGMIGIILLIIKKEWKKLGLLLLGVVGGGFFFSVYAPVNTSSQHPYYHVVLGIYERFFLLSPIFFSLLITVGVAGVYLLTKRISLRLILIPLLIYGVLIVNGTLVDFKEMKHNDFKLGHTFAKTLLESLPKNTVLVCFSEHSCFTGAYLQQVEKIRTDVLIITADYSQIPIEEIRIKYPGLIKTTTNRVSVRRSIILNRDLIRWQMDINRPVYIAGVATDQNVLSAMGLDGDPFYVIPEGCAMRVARKFEIPTKPNTCLPVEQEFLHAHITEKVPIAYMFNGYLLYQRYFNGLIYANRLCNKAALTEFWRGYYLYPRYSKLKTMIDSIKNVPQIATCQGFTGEVKVEDVLEKASQSEKKNDLQNAIYFQAQASVIKPKDLSIRFKLAQLYLTVRAYENALIEYSDILALEPKNEHAYQNYYKVKSAIDLGVDMSP